MSRFLPISVVVLLGACTVADDPYPLRWDPLPPASGTDCRDFAGTYADRGEAPGYATQPSLTRELFGVKGPWEKATGVRFAFPTQGDLDVTVSLAEGKPFVRRFTGSKGEYTCDHGQMVLRNRRWVASDLMSGRETVTIEMHRAEGYLVAKVNESMMGMMFMVVPLTGESARWYRFPLRER